RGAAGAAPGGRRLPPRRCRGAAPARRPARRRRGPRPRPRSRSTVRPGARDRPGGGRGRPGAGEPFALKEVVMPSCGPIHFRFDGPAGAPALVLSNSLGTDLGLWDAQAPRLAERLRLVRYDARGHGASAVTPGPYDVALLGRDVLALLDELALPRASFCGLSLGGPAGLGLPPDPARRPGPVG